MNVPTIIALTPTSAALFPVSPRPAILVPYRDNPEQGRAEQLARFLNHMNEYLRDTEEQKWTLIICEQSEDGRKFNRGAVLNAGAAMATSLGCTSLILHDVDLLPASALYPYYQAAPLHPIHIGWSWKDKYSYPRFMGGIMHLSLATFTNLNGYPATMYGWGGEDDVLRERLYKHQIPVYRPTIRGPETVMELTHVDGNAKPEWTNLNKKRDVEKALSSPTNGLLSTRYAIQRLEKYAPSFYKITLQLLR